MKSSYEGIGQWAATFACSDVSAGQVVKISDNGAVSACADGDAFCGVAVSVGRDGTACAVVLGGMVTADYSGAAPALGWSGLAADAEGGVKASESGRTYLVVDVNTVAKTVTFAM